MSETLALIGSKEEPSIAFLSVLPFCLTSGFPHEPHARWQFPFLAFWVEGVDDVEKYLTLASLS